MMKKEFSPVPSVETREQPVQRFDDPLWWEKDAELFKTDFGREVLMARRREVFDHGYCDQSHPLQKYINELAARLPQLANCRVVIVPFDANSNAGAYADGTFVITPKLIGRAKSKEAIMGVLLHEWTHFHRKHSELQYEQSRQIQREKRISGTFTSVMEGISSGRLHEYIADVQGAVIELDKLGFNPLGYKEFLEDVARREGSRGGGMTHGSTQERVLNITELLATIHLPSTANALEPQDEGVDQWIVERRGTYSFPALHESLQGAKKDEAKELMERRLQEIKQVPTCLLPPALDALWSEIGKLEHLEVVKKGGRAFHSCYLPPIRAAAELLATRIFPDQVAANDSFSTGLAASSLYARETLLPSKKTKFLWNYFRGDLEYFSFMQEGISGFLRSSEQLIYDHPGAVKGLIPARSLRLSDAHADWLVTKFPTPNLSQEEMAKWWSLATPMARTGALRTVTFDGAAIDTEHESGHHEIVAGVKSLFYAWAVRAIFPENSEKINNMGIPMDNPRIQSLRATLFNHPDAITVDGNEASQHASDRFHAKQERRVRIAQKEFSDRQEIKQGSVDKLIDEIVQALMDCETPNQISALLEPLLRDLGGVERFIGVLIKEKISQLHPAFATVPDLVIQLELFDTADTNDVLQLAEGYETILRRRKKAGTSDKEDIYIEDAIGTRFTKPAVLENLVRKLAPIKEYQNNIKLVKVDDLGVLREHVGRELFLTCVVEVLSHLPSLREMLDCIHSLEAKGILPKNWVEISNAGMLIHRIVEAIETGELQSISFDDRLRLGGVLRNASLRSEYCDQLAMDAEFKKLPFDEQARYVTGDNNGTDSLAGVGIIDSLAEQEPFNKEEYRKGFAALERRLQDLEKAGLYSHGVAILLDRVLPSAKAEDRLEFIRASILTRQDDRPLRTIILKEVRRQRALFGLSKSTDFDSSENKMNEVWNLDTSGETERQALHEANVKFGTDTLTTANSLVEELYRLQGAGKHLLLRKLLGGADGLLKKVETKGELLKILRQIWIERDNSPALVKTIEEIEEALVDDPEWEVVYLGLVGLLREQAFQRGDGSEKTGWKNLPALKELEAELDVRIDTQSVETWDQPPAGAIEQPWKFKRQWNQYGEQRLWTVLRTTQIEGDRERIASERTPLGFIKEVVAHSSAIGVRCLQNIGQVVDLSLAEERDLSDVYDRVKGQSRLAAVHHLERVFPGLWDAYETIGARIGGGSLFTVIQGTTHQKQERVIKMLNPNVPFHLDKASGLFVRSAERLAARHGGAYRLVPGLIEDVESSIRLEMNFAGFLEKDKAFYDQWNGFGEEGGRYRLRVPRSYGPEQPEFIQEEFVAAKNLTRWDELKGEKHDLKQIIRLLASSYIGQLAQGHALSDIHPGNEAVTADDELVLFDRTLYLELSPGERTLMMTLFTEDSNTGRAAALEGYFTEALGKEMPKTVIQSIRKASRTKDIRTSQEILLSLREAGLRPPLPLMFILKNLRVIDGMAKKAGWKRGMVEAING